MENTTSALISDDVLIRSILNTSGFFVLARAVGALLPIFLAFRFGAGQGTDAFFLAFAIQAFIAATLSSVAEVSIVPQLIKHDKGDAAAILRFLLLIGPAVVLGITVITGVAVATFFSPLIAKEFWKLVIFPAFSVGVALLSGGLNANNHFTLTAVTPGLRPVFIIGLLFLFPLSDPTFLAFCFTLSEVLLFLCLLGMTVRKGIFAGLGSSKAAFTSLKDAAILACGMVFLGLNPIVDRTIASWTGHGGISIIEYSFSMFFIPAGLLSGPILTILFSRWSRLNENSVVTAEADRAALWISLISLIIFAGFAFLGKPLLQLILSSSIENKQIDVLWLCAVILLGGLAPYVTGGLYARAMLASGQAKIVAILSIANAVMNAILDIVFYRPFGLVGIVISTVVTYLLIAILLRVCLGRMKRLEQWI